MMSVMMTEKIIFQNAENIPAAAQDRISHWLDGLGLDYPLSVSALTGDASFRRYFRVASQSQSYMLMDAPPGKEGCEAFVLIGKALYALGVSVPKLYVSNISEGLLLLEDFGDQILQDSLNDESVDHFYRTAMDDLMLIAACKSVSEYALPNFDRELYWLELDRTKQWYFQFLEKKLSEVQMQVFDSACERMIDSALSQPQVFVHRDFHSRNLMVASNNSLGVLDFQDAVMGPITYDLVSLLNDCYIDWPRSKVEAWVKYYYDKQQSEKQLPGIDFEQFLKYFDLIGLQRHIKNLGIFSRLKLSYNKPGYIQYMPRMYGYIFGICDRYPEFTEFKKLLQDLGVSL